MIERANPVTETTFSGVLVDFFCRRTFELHVGMPRYFLEVSLIKTNEIFLEFKKFITYSLVQ